jgi:hypothetical protein
MKKHTAETIKHFLGGKALILNQVYQLDSVAYYHNIGKMSAFKTHPETAELFNIADVYPILKPVNSLTEQEVFSIYMIDGELVKNDLYFEVVEDPTYTWSVFLDFSCSRYCKVSYDRRFYDVTLDKMHRMLEIGAGAIPNKNSHTGYVDFIVGIPCYTPKQIEELGVF